ncbi:MAG: hypothetical protein R3185_09615 [Candidatus Thermoplasmatota archaeon]|nr:hypothetical protein [Candidatus Thermoplasmatota archaeon]
MARKAQDAPLFVDGDHEVPSGTELRQGILATGMLRLGDEVTCHGDLFGARGIELGDNVTIQGNLFSHGEITWGEGMRLSGTIYSKAPRPLEEAMVRAGLSQSPERDLPMLRTAIADTLQLLLEIAWDGHLEGIEGYPDSWWGLEWDETIEVVERFLGAVDELYRGGIGSSTWTADEVFDVLFQKAVSNVVPLSMKRKDASSARFKVGRPSRMFDPEGPSLGWPWPAVSLLNLVGYASNAGFRLVLNGTEDLLTPQADPETIEVTIELLENPAEAA